MRVFASTVSVVFKRNPCNGVAVEKCLCNLNQFGGLNVGDAIFRDKIVIL